MKLSFENRALKSVKADALVLFTGEGKDVFTPGITRAKKLIGNKLDNIIELEQFKGKEGELLSIYTDGKNSTPRIILLGLGEVKKLTLEQYRRAGAAVMKKVSGKNVQHLVFDLDGALLKNGPSDHAEIVRAIAEGAILAHYKFDKYFTEKKDRIKSIQHLMFVSESDEHTKQIKKALNTTKIICEAVYLARDLENAPGNEIYPDTLALAARSSASKYGYRSEIWEKKKIEKEGFGGLLGVNSGSTHPPRFIILEYNKGATNLDTVVLVGKGVTFDSGGISIKPASGMSEMKMDMSGGAAVIGTLEAAARLNLPIHIIGLIPTTENLLSGSAMRPGDIIKHYGGKTSEVDNTDAEGRLILADALAYASTYKPKAVIDLATLTGACVVALGSHAAGMMGNDSVLMAALKLAGEKTYERVWELPLFDEYEKQIKSDIADVKNIGGRWGGAITAGMFLKKFIGDYKWIHLDIAGTAILEEEFPYAPKGGSGYGIRLLIEFFNHWPKNV
ncbi:MAG: leucyl aminopeptidase [Bacteroidota bacterium]